MKEQNKYRVPKKQWNRWSEIGKNTFNELFAVMEAQQSIFKHPKAPKLDKDHWHTTCWNAAWIAADTADRFYKQNTVKIESQIKIDLKALDKELNNLFKNRKSNARS